VGGGAGEGEGAWVELRVRPGAGVGRGSSLLRERGRCEAHRVVVGVILGCYRGEHRAVRRVDDCDGVRRSEEGAGGGLEQNGGATADGGRGGFRGGEHGLGVVSDLEGDGGEDGAVEGERDGHLASPLLLELGCFTAHDSLGGLLLGLGLGLGLGVGLGLGLGLGLGSFRESPVPARPARRRSLARAAAHPPHGRSGAGWCPSGRTPRRAGRASCRHTARALFLCPSPLLVPTRSPARARALSLPSSWRGLPCPAKVVLWLYSRGGGAQGPSGRAASADLHRRRAQLYRAVPAAACDLHGEATGAARRRVRPAHRARPRAGRSCVQRARQRG